MENSILKFFGSLDVKITPDFCSHEPTQLAATPAPPCPEFSTWTKLDPSNLVALILNPSFLMGLSVFQLSNPSPDVIDKVSPKRAWQTLSQSDTVVLVWSGPEQQSQRLYEVAFEYL